VRPWVRGVRQVTVWVVLASLHSASRHSESSWNVAPVGLGGTGTGVGFGVGRGVGIVAAGDADGARVGPDVVIGVGLTAAGDPSGDGLAGVPAHAARTTTRRRDAALRFAFICRRWCYGLSRR
jgi:hypothetical protein